MKLTELYKSFNDKPLHEGYDPGNEPLEIQYHEDQQLYYIEPEDIEAYVSGETVFATDPDRGMDDVEVNRENSDVSGVSEDELEDFMVSGDRSADDVDDDDRFSGMDDVFGADLEESKKRIWNRIKNWVKGDITLNQLQGGPGDGEGLEEETCTEEEIREGTCGYGVDGELGDEPAGSHLYILDEKKPKLQESIMKKRLQKLANITLINEQRGFKKGGFDKPKKELPRGHGIDGGGTGPLINGCIDPNSSAGDWYNYQSGTWESGPSFNPEATADCAGNPLPGNVLSMLAQGPSMYSQLSSYAYTSSNNVDTSCCIYYIGIDD